MKHIFSLLVFLFIANLAYSDIKETKVDKDIKVWVKNSNENSINPVTFKATGEIDSNGVTILRTNKLVSSTDLPTTTDTYAWHLNGTSSADGTAWLGGANLTANGTVASVNNHLGSNVYCSLNGTDAYWESSSTVFDTANEDFTFMAWVKSPANINDAIASKHQATSDKRSWALYFNAASSLYFNVFSTGAATANNGTTFSPSSVNSSTYTHIAVVYDYTNTNFCRHTIAENGTIRKYETYSSNCNRYNSADSEFKIGAMSVSGSPDYFFEGQIADPIYARTAYTPNQIRKAYAAGARRFAQIDANGIVHIEGRKKVSVQVFPTANYEILATAFGTDCTGYTVYAPESLSYEITVEGELYAYDTDTGGANETRLRLTDDNVVILGTVRRISNNGTYTGYSTPYLPFSMKAPNVYVTSGSLISLQAYKDSDANENSQLIYSTTNGTPYLYIESKD